jgi:hypothetical protein
MIEAKFTLIINRILDWLRGQYEKGNNPIVAVVPLDPIIRGTCYLCQKRDANLVWQIQFLDGTRIDAACLTCGGKILDLVQEFEAKE